MTCNTCKHSKFHIGGSWYTVAKGGDDPFSYEYCTKGYWSHDMSEISEVVNDFYGNCPDYENINNNKNNNENRKRTGT